MRAARTRFTMIAATLGLAALVVVLGAAQAAPSGKSYTANVRVTNAATSLSVFTLEMTNDTKSRQPLGSANFTAPLSFTVPAAPPQVVTIGGNTWTITTDGSRVVAFRANSNGDALLPGERMAASVGVTVPATCSSALWGIQGKQSNDFSGSPGNDFSPSSATDLIPLGSFSIAPIQTIKDGQTIPAILTDVAHTSTTTAKDTCGNTKTNYSGANRTQTLLTEATFLPLSGLNWTNGIGTVEITPEWTETENRLTVTDPTTGITASSDPFDTTDKLCTPSETVCEWENEDKNITARTEPPLAGDNIGIGFNPNLSYLNFACDNSGVPVGGVLVNINPRGYTAPYTVELTYEKSVSGNGPASSFAVCISKDNGDSWTLLEPCASSPPVQADAPCIQTRKRTNGGDLFVVLYLDPADPYGGLT